MTVSSETWRLEYAGNGVTTAFTTPQFLALADIKVYLVDDSDGSSVTWALTTDYTLDGAGSASGTVTAIVAPAANFTLVIVSDPAITQAVDYVENDPFPAASHEGALDKLTLIVRRLAGRITRSLQLADSDTSGASTTMPVPVALEVFRWNADGTAVETFDPGSAVLEIPADESVTTQKLADLSVSTTKLADGALSADVSGRAKMEDGFVNSEKLDVVALKDGTTAVSQSASDNSTKIATTEYADAQAAAAVSDVIKTGAVVKGLISGSATVVAANGSTPDDDTIPLVSEGTQVISTSFSMSNASDMVEVSVSIPGTSNNAVHFIVALYAGSTCIGAQRLYASTSAGKNLTCIGYHTPASTASITYSARVGNGLGATFYTNADNSGSRVLGSISRSIITVKQLKA